MSQNNTLTNGKLQRCETRRRTKQITAEAMQTYGLLKFALARSNGSSFLLITQYEMRFMNKSEATKRSKDRKIYGKCTNGTNRRSRVWPVCFIYIVLGIRDFTKSQYGNRENDKYFDGIRDLNAPREAGLA